MKCNSRLGLVLADALCGKLNKRRTYGNGLLSIAHLLEEIDRPMEAVDSIESGPHASTEYFVCSGSLPPMHPLVAMSSLKEKMMQPGLRSRCPCSFNSRSPKRDDLFRHVPYRRRV